MGEGGGDKQRKREREGRAGREEVEGGGELLPLSDSWNAQLTHRKKGWLAVANGVHI